MAERIQNPPERITSSDLAGLVGTGFRELYVSNEETAARVVQSGSLGVAIAGVDPRGSIPEILIFLAEKGDDTAENVLTYNGETAELPSYNFVGLAEALHPMADEILYDEIHSLIIDDIDD